MYEGLRVERISCKSGETFKLVSRPKGKEQPRDREARRPIRDRKQLERQHADAFRSDCPVDQRRSESCLPILPILYSLPGRSPLSLLRRLSSLRSMRAGHEVVLHSQPKDRPAGRSLSRVLSLSPRSLPNYPLSFTIRTPFAAIAIRPDSSSSASISRPHDFPRSTSASFAAWLSRKR